MSEHTPTPWDWQKFGNKYCLTGQYGSRPIVLSSGRKGLTSRDPENDLLVPFDPSHPDAEFIVRAANNFDALLEACKEAWESYGRNGDLSVDALQMLEAAIQQASAQ